MMALPILAVLLSIATVQGYFLLRLLRPPSCSRALQVVYGAALGLGVTGYTVMLVGVLGFLRPIPTIASIAVVTGVLALLGRKRPPLPSDPPPQPRSATESKLAYVLLSICGLMGLISLVNCFVAPGAYEWDALTYHLAAPKVYLDHAAIVYLPTDHHSSFPFLVEMLFTLGLMFNGYALANLFHLTFGVLCVLGIVHIGRREAGGIAGEIAAVVFCTIPIAIWEAGAAYIEMGWACFVLLAIGAVLRYKQERDLGWLRVAGVCIGFALGIKMLVLVPFFLIWLLLTIGGAKFRDLRWFMLCAIVVGSPFYIKSAITTGNPIYPFLSNIFPSRNWSYALEKGYNTEQRSFGLNQTLENVASDVASPGRPEWMQPSILDRLRNTVLAPFSLVSVPKIYNNLLDPRPATHLGFLLVALAPLILLAPNLPTSVKWMGALAGLWFFVWAQIMQYTRYMLPIAPVLAIAGGAALIRLERGSKGITLAAGIAIGLQSAFTLSTFASETLSRSQTIMDAEAREVYLRKSVNSYASTTWLNKSTPTDAGVVLYEDTRGFYLDRPYLWGNSPHSLYIPYESIANGDELADWFISHGIHYALVNLQFCHWASEGDGPQRLMDAVRSHDYETLVRAWYSSTVIEGERWRNLLGDALASGRVLVRTEGCANACAVLEFTPPRSNPNGSER